MSLDRPGARALKELMAKGGALGVLLFEVEAEVESRTQTLLNLDLDSPEDSAKARKLQGEIRGGHQVLDRIKEIINERSV